MTLRRAHRKSVFSELLLLALAAGCAIFTGCSSSAPKTDQDGLSWKDEWTTVGNVLGIEDPAPFTLLDNKEALAAEGLYYATWTDGDSRPYTNQDGDEVPLFDAQIYLLLGESGNTGKAAENLDNWLQTARRNYLIDEETSPTWNKVTYTVLSYHCNPDVSPYDHGVSAFAAYGDSTVCAELTCLEEYDGDLYQELSRFLTGCHFAS